MPKGIYPRNNTPTTPSTYSWQHHLPTLIASIPTESDAIAYLVQHGILQNPKEFTCYYCGYVGCRVKSKKNVKGLKCNRGSCGRSLSLIKGTIFSGSKTPIHQSLYICSFFLSLSPPSTVISQLHCSSNTVSHWYTKLRKWISCRTSLQNVGEAKKEHLMKRARKRDALVHEVVAVWRERHESDLWAAFLEVLKCPDQIMDDFERNEDDFNDLENALCPVLPPMNGFEDGDLMTGVVEGGGSGDVEETRWNDLAHVEPCERLVEPPLQPKETNKRSTEAAGAGAYDFDSNLDETLNPLNNQSNEPPKKRAKKIHSIPSFLDLCCLVPTEEKAVEYLTSHGIFTPPKDTICPHCQYKGFRRKETNNPKSLKCNRCNKGQSIARSTFFQNTKASYRTILHLAAHWLHKTPRTETISQLKCSSATITEFYRNFRKLIEKTMDDDLRLMALTADKKAMAAEIPKGARRNELEDHYCVVLWREANRDNLWGAFMVALCGFYVDGDHDVV